MLRCSLFCLLVGTVQLDLVDLGGHQGLRGLSGARTLVSAKQPAEGFTDKSGERSELRCVSFSLLFFSIDLTVRAKTLVGVVGQVGAGKSSLISALLGEMEKQAGRVSTKVGRRGGLASNLGDTWGRQSCFGLLLRLL